MPCYKVKLIFKYSDIVHVEADSEDEAIQTALAFAEPEFECLYDSEVTIEDKP